MGSTGVDNKSAERDTEKQPFEHRDGSSAGSLGRFEGAPAGWDPETSTWDSELEKKIIHRVDWRLLPILGAMYAISLIDRVNLSNAFIAGMAVELKLYIGDRYSIALLMFFIPYFLFELPSNLILRKVGAAKWLGGICFAWGIIMMCMGFVKTWQTLVVMRTILGFFEAGFLPGCVYLISCWYVRYEVQKRLAAFYLTSVFAAGFSPLLASGLIQMEGLQGYLGWRWIFIIEGLITIVIAGIAVLTIIEFPDKLLESNHPFLTPGEVEVVKFRIDKDRNDAGIDSITWAKAKLHFSDWKLWAFSFLFMSATIPAYAFAYFLPVILKDSMGYSTLMSQVLTAPPYICACIIAFLFAIWADRARVRGPFIVVQAILTIIGLAITGFAKGNGARYFGVFLGITGAQGNVPAILAYQSNNIRTNSKRSLGSALQVALGAIGGIIASTVFRQEDSPEYIPGIWTAIGSQILMLVIVGTTSLYFWRKNKLQSQGTILENAEGFRYTY